MKRKSLSRGIVLITTLFTLVFILMITTTVLITGKQSMRWAGSYECREQALNAAMSGVAYAKMRIQKYDRQKKIWQGAEPKAGGGYESKVENPDIANLKGFTVKEQLVTSDGRGIVEGTLTGDGPPAKFFIYFAPPSSEKFKDDLVGWVTPKYLSLNNSYNFASASSYLIDSVTKYRDVPYCTSLIVVQGVCGGVSRHAEIMLLKYPSAPMDSAGISNGNMSIALNGNDAEWFVAAELGMPALIRSNGNLNIRSSGLDDDFVKLNGGRAKVSNTVSLNPEYKDPIELGLIPGQGYQGEIPTITFDDLKEFIKKTQPVNLKAGTYTFSRGLDGQLVIEYDGYEGDSKKYKETDTITVNDPYQAFTFGKDFALERASHKVLMTAPINVVQAGDLKDIVLKGSTTSNYELSINMKSNSNKTVYISNSLGSVQIDGEITGKGAVFSEGDITFEGRSALSSESGTVCLFANGDINLNDFSKLPEANPEGDPSEYIAKAVDEYLDAKKNADKAGTFKVLDKSKDIPEILKEKITHDTVSDKELSKVLSEKFSYLDKAKQEELVDEILRNNNDGSYKKEEGKAVKIYYKFTNSKYPERFEDIINPPVNPDTSKGRSIKLSDQILKGVIYATKNFNANLGNSKLTVQGTLLSKEGNINVDAGNAAFIYDPKYLQPLYDLGKYSYRQLYWTVH